MWMDPSLTLIYLAGEYRRGNGELDVTAAAPLMGSSGLVARAGCGYEVCLFGNDFDFEELRPKLAGDEEATVDGVIGDSVEDGFGIGDRARRQKACEVDPAEHLAGCG